MKLKLPIGIQSFEKMRSEGFYYVDKTHFIARLVEEGTYYFLSRPRRFGKSLFIDTLKQAFLGKKELFTGLYLEDNWDWNENYPVIHIDFALRNFSIEDIDRFKKHIFYQLRLNQEYLQIELKDPPPDDYAGFLEMLIRKASKTYKKKIVILIDEYDKPILDNIQDKEKAREIREILKNFYGVLKPLDVHIKFVFLTGVSKFSKVSIFSGLNQLNDITLDPTYAAICGYTEEELTKVFAPELEGIDLELIRDWYNGYSFCGEKVYNPFDVLLYFSKREFRPFWFETGTPEFLIKLIVEKGFLVPQMEEVTVTERFIGSFDLDFIEPENLLFQTGYLSIKRCFPSPLRGMTYTLSYPNREVKMALNDYIFTYLTQLGARTERYYPQLERIFRTGDMKEFEKVLRSLFASIPYDWYRRNEIDRFEGFYVSVVYSFLAGAGFLVIPEDATSGGKIDVTVIYENNAYVIEFKVVENRKRGKKPLEQIKAKGYHEKYVGRYKNVYLVGIEFGKRERNIIRFGWEKI